MHRIALHFPVWCGCLAYVHPLSSCSVACAPTPHDSAEMVLHTLQLGDLHFGHFAGLFFLGLVVFLMSMPLIQPAICPVSMQPCFDIDLGPSL